MAMKEWLAWLPPPRALVALVLATGGFSLRLAACHITHSPTLVVDTCHALCRLLGLLTTLIAFKFDRRDEGRGRETRLRNTFGWARIEVVGRLSVHVLFASFGLALLVSALQLSVHSSHAQPPCDPHPRVTIAVAVVGLLVHVVGYLLLAGEELNNGRRLSVTEGGGVVLKAGGRVDALAYAPADILSSLFVMAAGLTSEWADPASRTSDLMRLVDPTLSAVASVLLIVFNYPFMREAGMVLLQTVPEGLGTCELRAAALRVPGVLALHELHVWQLYPRHVVATAHVFYRSHLDFLKSSVLVADVFTRHGISLVTLQPEFADIPEGMDEGGQKESDALVSRANESCGRPCAAHCTAPRCCGPAKSPAEPGAHSLSSVKTCDGTSNTSPAATQRAASTTTLSAPATPTMTEQTVASTAETVTPTATATTATPPPLSLSTTPGAALESATTSPVVMPSSSPTAVVSLWSTVPPLSHRKEDKQ